MVLNFLESIYSAFKALLLVFFKKEQKFAEAAETFKKIAETTKDNALKSSAYHNLGNSLLEAQQFAESVEAYKNALRLNPKDEETRYNLAYAQKKLKEQQSQQNKNC